MTGYIPISRKLFEHPFWIEKREFSHAEAWIDLLRSVRFEANSTKVIIGNKTIMVNRGEIPASLRFLADRWQWSKNKVDAFLNLLKDEGMINKRTANGTNQTIIKVCNYDSYNQFTENNGQQTGQEKDSTRTAPGQHRDKSNKDNKDNKDNNLNIPPLVPPREKTPEDENPESIPIKSVEKKEKSSAEKERTVFIPPSVEMVTEFCKENGYTVSAWKFVNYYTSNGWLVGKNKMKDWKAAVRTWQSKENENGNRQLPANNQTNPSGCSNYPKGNDAANKRAELANLDNLAEAVLRSIGSTNG